MRLLMIEGNRNLAANLFDYFEARGHVLDVAPDGDHRRGHRTRPGTARSGIGLDLIQRLCEHLGWRLCIHSTPGLGARVTLDVGKSRNSGGSGQGG